MRQDAAVQRISQFLRGASLSQLPELPFIDRQRQSGRVLHALHGPVELLPLKVDLSVVDEIGNVLLPVVPAGAIHAPADPVTDFGRCNELGMLLRLLGGKAPAGFEVLVPVLVFRLDHSNLVIAVLVENFCQPSTGLDARRVMIQAEADGAEAGVLLQHPEHGVFAGPTEGHIAVFLPASGVAGKKGQQVDRRFEDIEPVTGAGMVEAAPGIAALHVDAGSLANVIDAALVSVAWNAVFVFANEDGVVVLPGLVLGYFAALVQQTCPDKGADHIPIQKAAVQQIGIYPAHIPVRRRQGKFLFGFLLLLWGGGIDTPLFAVQQTGDGLRIGEIVELLDEGDGTAALLHGVVVPLIAPDGDAVVTGHSVLRPGGDQLLPMAAEELHQIHLTGPELLLFGKMNIGHTSSLHSSRLLFSSIWGILMVRKVRNRGFEKGVKHYGTCESHIKGTDHDPR